MQLCSTTARTNEGLEIFSDTSVFIDLQFVELNYKNYLLSLNKNGIFYVVFHRILNFIQGCISIPTLILLHLISYTAQM